MKTGLWMGAALVVAMESLAAAPVAVEPAKGYNSWPMVQALGNKLVTIYRMGTKHNPGEKGCGTFARVSSDGGKTWSDRRTVTNDPNCGETAIAKGCDESGAALFWVRSYGPKPLFNLYRTTDGEHFDLISQPQLDKGPWMQVTDIFRVPSVGLMSFWFGGSYKDDDKPRRWGVATSTDQGTNWTFRVVGENMKLQMWPTEPSGVYLGDGRILCIARTEGGGRQLQLTSTDSGSTWKVEETNIRDVAASTPSLVYDEKTGLVYNYYYQRGKAILRCRVAKASEVFDHPMSWPESVVLADDKGLPAWDTGNANATQLKGTHYVTWYRGKSPDCEVVVLPVNPRLVEIASSLPEEPNFGIRPMSDKAAWARIAEKSNVKELVKRADRLLKEPVVATPDELYLDFTRNGNRTRYQDANDKLNGHLTMLVLAEAFTDQGRYIGKICDYFDAECAQKSWTLPAHDAKLTCFRGKPHIDLGAGMKACLLATLMTYLGDRLPSATREKVTAEIERRIFRPYLATSRGEVKNRDHWWFMTEMNWNSVCNDTCVRAALLLIRDRMVRAEFVEAAERTAKAALKGYGADGYCFEGMGYWNYGYGHYVYLGLAVRAATGGKVDLFADPKTKKVMEYAYGYQLENRHCPSFADGGGIPYPPLLALGRQVWPDLVNTVALKAPIGGGYSWPDASDTFALRAFGQEPPPVAPTMDALPIRTWFPSAQVLISRESGKGREPLAVAMKGGNNNELHNHNDLGSYAIVCGGVEYAGDPAGEVYTRRTFSGHRYDSKMLNSYGHPVPRIAERLQPSGAKFAAKVLKTDFTEARDEYVIDLTKAYAVTNLAALTRTLVFDRVARTVTVRDDVRLTSPAAFETPIVTYADVVFDYAQDKLRLRKTPGKFMDVTVATTGGDWTWKTELIENPTRVSAKRLAVTFTKPVTEASVTITYAAK